MEQKGNCSRRNFFKKTGWSCFAFVNIISSACFGRFFYPRIDKGKSKSFNAGFPQEYTVGTVSTRYLSRHQVWIVRDEGGFYALRAVCTHLGCVPVWMESEGKFKCPCHGSGFTREGINYEGPAPRPLERVKIELADDGQLTIDTSIVFREERGEWPMPEAYVHYV